MRTDPAHRPSPARSRPGFTLVELLVVIGIIALLVGILMPTLSAVQREGRKTVCMSNLRQIGMGVTLYVDHHKGKYPRSPALPSVNPYNLQPATVLLAPFIATGLGTSPDLVLQGKGAAAVFRCPSDDVIFPDEKTSYFYHHEL
ncbi:MAG: putative major pilin subunit, partial [Phycisphaerales bacterium]|nr:putative major pilin subunit [Phycisphaerales bacterium]